MQFTTLLPLLALPALITATACVAGGPAWEVTAAGKCCAKYNGTWYQFYAVQAICVVSDTPAISNGYQACVAHIGGSPPLDTKCIPGDGGLETPSTTTSTTDRITIGSAPTLTAS